MATMAPVSGPGGRNIHALSTHALSRPTRETGFASGHAALGSFARLGGGPRPADNSRLMWMDPRRLAHAPIVANIPTAAAAMTSVASHPTAFSPM